MKIVLGILNWVLFSSKSTSGNLRSTTDVKILMCCLCLFMWPEAYDSFTYLYKTWSKLVHDNYLHMLLPESIVNFPRMPQGLIWTWYNDSEHWVDSNKILRLRLMPGSAYIFPKYVSIKFLKNLNILSRRWTRSLFSIKWIFVSMWWTLAYNVDYMKLDDMLTNKDKMKQWKEKPKAKYTYSLRLVCNINMP